MAQKSSDRPFWVRWYKTENWKRLRKKVLAHEPLCRFCKKKKIITQAEVVDHIRPHKGNVDLFYDIHNLQSLCKPCHSSTKQRLEKSGEFGCDVNGYVKEWQ